MSLGSGRTDRPEQCVIQSSVDKDVLPGDVARTDRSRPTRRLLRCLAASRYDVSGRIVRERSWIGIGVGGFGQRRPDQPRTDRVAFEHAASEGMAAVQIPGHVHVECPLSIVQRSLHEVVCSDDPGIVDEHLHRTEIGSNILCDRRNPARIAGIADKRDSLDAGLRDDLLGGLSPMRFPRCVGGARGELPPGRPINSGRANAPRSYRGSRTSVPPGRSRCPSHPRTASDPPATSRCRSR